MNRWMQHMLTACTAVLIGLCMASCASAQPKKLQTYEELFLKLKEGFYSGRLIEPDFYSKELGYPLMAPLRFLPQNVQDLNRSQELVLDGDEFRGDSLVVMSSTNVSGQKVIIVEYGRSGHQGEACMKEGEFQNLWGYQNLIPWRDPAFHRRIPAGVKYVPGIYWRAEAKTEYQTMGVRFEFLGEGSKCLGNAAFLITQIKG
jgi:hypothetical protein